MGTLIVGSLAKPFHDFAVPLMDNQIKIDMLSSGIATRAHIHSLKVDRQNMIKASNPAAPVAANPTASADVNVVVPTIVWEVCHTQKCLSLFCTRMWYRCYDGIVCVVFLVR